MSKMKRLGSHNVLLTECIHVDNGGTSFSLVETEDDRKPSTASIEISDSYYGYSESVLKLYEICWEPENLLLISKFFEEAAKLMTEKLAKDRENY